jgi:hypothetical protein
MALTVREVLKTAVKDRYLHIHRVDFDASYPTGGEALTSANLGFGDSSTRLVVIALQAGGYTFEYDRANAKLKAFYYDYNNAADGAALEVPDTTNLSTVTGVTLLTFGKEPA